MSSTTDDAIAPAAPIAAPAVAASVIASSGVSSSAASAPTTVYQAPYCRVQLCRHKHTHVAAGHRCGTCGQYGHGTVECGTPTVKAALAALTQNDRLPAFAHCTISDCLFAWSHTTGAHHCRKCKQSGHSMMQCTSSIAASSTIATTVARGAKLLRIKCPTCRADSQVSTDQKTAFGVGECVVCIDSTAQVFLPVCGHVCLCWQCARDIDANAGAAV